MKYKINVTHEVRFESFQDILCTALEGGSNYWMESYVIRSKRDNDGEYLWFRITDADDDAAEPLVTEIGPEQLAAAVQTILHGTLTNDAIVSDIVHNVEDLGCVDANTADAIVQVAVFGEIVYG